MKHLKKFENIDTSDNHLIPNDLIEDYFFEIKDNDNIIEFSYKIDNESYSDELIGHQNKHLRKESKYVSKSVEIYFTTNLFLESANVIVEKVDSLCKNEDFKLTYYNIQTSQVFIKNDNTYYKVKVEVSFTRSIYNDEFSKYDDLEYKHKTTIDLFCDDLKREYWGKVTNIKVERDITYNLEKIDDKKFCINLIFNKEFTTSNISTLKRNIEKIINGNMIYDGEIRKKKYRDFKTTIKSSSNKSIVVEFEILN